MPSSTAVPDGFDEQVDRQPLDAGHRRHRLAPLVLPSCTNSGQIRSSTVSRLSATSRRDQSYRRSRRSRVSGNWPQGVEEVAEVGHRFIL